MVSGADLIAAWDVPLHRKTRVEPQVLHRLVRDAKAAMLAQEPDVRPKTQEGEPGGLVYVRQPRALLIPDLHARREFLVRLFGADAAGLGFPGRSVADLAAAGQASVVCLGDVLHTEGREAAARWMLAERYREYGGRTAGGHTVRNSANLGTSLDSSPDSSSLDNPPLEEEMLLGLATLEEVLLLKALIPENFHCLKGNHDNVSNAGDHGDFPFFKYAQEGQMTAEWFRAVYGEQMWPELRDYELLLPLVAVGRAFCASHAEPAVPLGFQDILDYRSRPEVVEALIWTDNGQARRDAALRTLKALLSKDPASIGARWFSGHRPVSGLWAEREAGLVIQIHNPEHWQFVWIDNSVAAFPSCSLFRVDENGTLSLCGQIAGPNYWS
jgi:hypothetical protein